MIYPTTTAIVAALLALLQAGLMLYTAMGRGQFSTGLGDGGHEALTRRIRMHGNLAENAALFVVLLGLTELSGVSPLLVRIAGPAFVLVRLAHAFGLSMVFGPGANPFRAVGAVGTVVCFVVLALALLIRAV